MAYSNSIEALKQLLDGYSEDENALAEKYEAAISGAKADLAKQITDTEAQYQSDRNDAYYDSLRGEKDTMNILAKRGLGVSGEVGQAKLNSEIILNNRLSELAKGKNSAIYDLTEKNNNKINALEIEKIKDAEDIAGKKAGVLSDIAEIELKAAQSSKNSGGSGSTGGSGSGSAEDYSGADGSTSAEENKKGYVPNISAKELAKTVSTKAASGSEDDSETRYNISKYIIGLIDDYGIDSEYLDEFLFMLSGYGYTLKSRYDMKKDVITYESRELNNSVYSSCFKKYVKEGMNSGDASSKASATAKAKQIAFIAENAESIKQFREICSSLGFSNKTQNEYIAKMPSSVIGGSGSGSVYKDTNKLQISTKD